VAVLSSYRSISDNVAMSSPPNYRGYRFPPEIVSPTVWLYHRFTLSLRDIEDLLAERNIIGSYESIRMKSRDGFVGRLLSPQPG